MNTRLHKDSRVLLIDDQLFMLIALEQELASDGIVSEFR